MIALRVVPPLQIWQRALLLGMPAAMWTIAFTLALRPTVEEIRRPQKRAKAHHHVKEGCSFWEWRIPRDESSLIPRWRIQAVRAATIEHPEGQLEESLQDAHCAFYTLFGPSTLLATHCPCGVYNYKDRSLIANDVTFEVYSPFNWRTDSPETLARSTRGICQELKLRLTRPHPMLEMRTFTADWTPQNPLGGTKRDV